MVTFEMRAVKPGLKKTPEGDVPYPIVEHIRVKGPIDESCRPATDTDRNVYAAEYRAFKAGKVPEAAPPATPEVSFEMRPFKGDVNHPKGMVEYVRIARPGSEVVHRAATDADRANYFLAYAAFKKAPAMDAAVTVKTPVDPELLAKTVEAVADAGEATPVDRPAETSFFKKKKR